MTWDGEQRARVGLAMACAGTADLKLARLVATEGAEAVWMSLLTGDRDSRWGIRARKVDLDMVEARTEVLGLQHLVPSDPRWPTGLNDLDHVEVSEMGGAPWGLWVAGDPDLASSCAASVAVVGSRAATHYGEWAAAEIAAGLAAHRHDRMVSRATVVSGGAYGIDAAAHRGALAVGGPTVAVLAGGLDDLYPKGNAGLLRQVRQHGSIVSELAPGTSPTRVAFLARNRLIAGMTACTVIVEAARRSGARNTVAWARALGRVLAAVPGPINSDRSLTPHQLIRDQEAVLVADAEQVRELLSPLVEPPLPGVEAPARELDEMPTRLLEVREALRRRGGTPVDEVVARTGLGVAECLDRLGELEDWGWVRLLPDGSWGLRRPSGH
ncbi:DNA-processing protein DprA [Aestuariimicrobium ganziense]|uniref:DNA-processing protein DprA n=1 Tax=Aestuariimicrobium ganziense TaxID=2773677 RepID=UPI001940F613|nr:DNA-protecting protein DprA [Aestuariimicrobium ganziense]